MSTDVTFVNQYTETLYENFDAIIKQNIMFQTKLKIAEKELAIKEDTQNQVGTLTDENRELKSKVSQLESASANYKVVHEDKSRLQVALTENSQEKNKLQSSLNDVTQELTRLRNQVNEIPELRKKSGELNSLMEEHNKLKIQVVEVEELRKKSGELSSLIQEHEKLKIEVAQIVELKKENQDLKNNLDLFSKVELAKDSKSKKPTITHKEQQLKAIAGTF